MPAITYAFRDDTTPLGFRNAAKADPQVIGETLTAIAVNGRLKPADVVRAAAERRHSLHQFFTWDDAEAAKAYRLDEARALISSVEVVEVDATNAHDERRRAFLSITDNHGRAYRPVQLVVADARLQAMMMAQLIGEMRSMRRRYREISDICVFIDLAIGAAEELMAKEAPPEA
jgi:hypothetical protein